MHASSAAGDVQAAARLALDLPVDGYPDKVGVLLSALAHSAWYPDSQQLAVIRGIPEMFAGAVLVKAAAGAPPHPGRWNEIRDALALDPKASETAWMSYLMDGLPSAAHPEQVQEVMAALEQLAPEDGHDRIPSLPERVVATRYGVPLIVSDDEAQGLSQENPSILDDVIDQDMVSVSGDVTGLAANLRARLQPASLTDEQLDDLGHDWERCRRAYEAGNLSDDETDTPAGRHYLALRALRSGDTSRRAALIDPDGVLDAVATTFDSGVLQLGALADPTTWPVLDRFIKEAHVQEAAGTAGRWYANRALAAVFSWDWDQAVHAGKQALRNSQDEALRDEALNIIAFAQFQLGQDESAIAALERALEGEYTSNLQANAGVVAEHMAPDRAAVHLGRLAAEAPSVDLRLAAVRRAFHVWSQNRPVWEDEDEDTPIPIDLLGAMRSLTVADTPLDDHREIMRLLAYFDSEWAADPTNTESSPHTETWDHKLYVARASHDPNAYIQTLASALKESPDMKWLADERDGFVASMRSLIFEDVENVGPAAYAYAAIDAGLPMEPFDRVTLTCGAVISICRSLTTDKQEPSDTVYYHFLKATEASDELDTEQRELIDDVLAMAGNTYAACVAIARNEMLQDGFNALNTVGARLYGVPKHRVKWSALADSMRPLRDMADESVRMLKKAKKHARGDEIQEGIDGLVEEFTRLRSFAANPRSAF